MPVFVDRFRDARVPVKWRGGGHLGADRTSELVGFALRLGLPLAHCQGDHFDLTRSLRAKAVKLGAAEIDAREFVRRARRGSEDPAR